MDWLYCYLPLVPRRVFIRSRETVWVLRWWAAQGGPSCSPRAAGFMGSLSQGEVVNGCCPLGAQPEPNGRYRSVPPEAPGSVMCWYSWELYIHCPRELGPRKMGSNPWVLCQRCHQTKTPRGPAMHSMENQSQGKWRTETIVSLIQIFVFQFMLAVVHLVNH